jgi:hypothetical protein
LEDISTQIESQEDKNYKLKTLMSNYDVPTVEVYIELKLSLARLERREEMLVRKKRLEILKNTKDCFGVDKIKRPQSKLARRLQKSNTLPGRLYHGPTFNIVYNPGTNNKDNC